MFKESNCKGEKMKCYKITDKNDQTFGGCQWGENVTHTADGQGDLCSEHWIHFYTDRFLAVIFNPIHGGYDPKTMHLWECEAEIDIDDHGLKFGTKKLTTIRRIPVPEISIETRIRFGIYCALEVFTNISVWLSSSVTRLSKANAMLYIAVFPSLSRFTITSLASFKFIVYLRLLKRFFFIL